MSDDIKHCNGCGQDKSVSEFQVPTDYGGTRQRKWCHDCCEKLFQRQREADQRLQRAAEHQAERRWREEFEAGRQVPHEVRKRLLPEYQVAVRRQWNDWREAVYTLSELESPHWDDVSGGVNAKAPRPFIHGYVWCDRMESGELAHSCSHGAGPHRIKVCVVKKSNTPKVMRILQGAAE